MKRLLLAWVLASFPVAPAPVASLFTQPVTSAAPVSSWIRLWQPTSARAQGASVTTKEAFEAAKELGTIEAWTAFLNSYPSGFYADLARAYVHRLNSGAGVTAPASVPPPAVAAPAPGSPPTARETAPRPASAPVAPASAGPLAPTDPNKPAVARGGPYMGFAERFNRYYTDPAWRPSRTVYVSPNGNGNGSNRDTPMSARAAIGAARPGTQINFLRGKYQACFEFTKENSGSYDEPVVVYGERNEDKSLGVALTCCNTGRQVCFNFEDADYVALDGFEMIGGRYGVRTIGAGYPASQHARGIAVIDNNGHDQDRDPFFSAQVDWAVWERNVASGAKSGDGHGFYISNGGDWNIVRYNETHSNVSSDFQINADPAATCKEVGIPYNDPRCDAFAGTGEGGQGASDYFLVDSNYFHHGVGNGNGPNFTSVRRSVVRNNIFGFYNARHGVSFWQETDNPKLGSSENKILHNLFITTQRHGVKFEAHSTGNEFANNVILGVRINGSTVSANPSALLMEVDDTVAKNVYRSNLYVSGKLEGRQPNAEETVRADFSPGWFAKFPTALNRDPNDFKPIAGAPLLGGGARTPGAPSDRYGIPRPDRSALGPIETR